MARKRPSARRLAALKGWRTRRANERSEIAYKGWQTRREREQAERERRPARKNIQSIEEWERLQLAGLHTAIMEIVANADY